MRHAVETGLPPIDTPLEWVVTADGIFYTALVAVKPGGGIETGDIRAQTIQTLENLKHCLAAAGGTMDDVTQVLIYLTDGRDVKAMNEIYAQYFRKPYPNRATVVVSALVVPGCIVEMVVHAHIASNKANS